MRKYASLLICLTCSLQAHAQTFVESIQIHAEMIGDGPQLDLVSYARGQNMLRVSIHDTKKRFGTDIIYRKGKMAAIEQLAEAGVKRRALTGEEAAGNLLDMLALNPQYHFQQNNGFDLSIKLLDGYRIAYQQTDEEVNPSPHSLKLYEIEDDGEKLLRSIEYLSLMEEITEFIQPKELRLTDETTGESGRIIVQSVEYNVGIPGFLFEISDTGGNLTK